MKHFSGNKKVQISLSALLGIIICLYIGHHFLNLWEQSALKLLTLFLSFVIVSTVIVNILLKKIAEKKISLTKKQKIMIFVLALVVSIFLSVLTMKAPYSYQKTIVSPHTQSGFVHLYEMKIDGNVVNLESETIDKKWIFENGVYISTEESSPLVITSYSQVNKPCEILFLGSAESTMVEISQGFIHKKLEFSNDENNLQQVQFRTTYRGIPGFLFISFLTVIDVLFYFLLISFLFILHEYSSLSKAEWSNQSDQWKSHIPNLIILLVSSLALHLWMIFTIPLFIDIDSGGYLQGAIHWINEGNLQGVSNLRGPGTTFLFTPLFLLFGRNPWGIKIFYHMISIGSIFLAYWIGWLLGENKSVALITGILVLLFPDIYIFSTILLSENLNIFFTALFVALIIYAYKQMSFKRILFALISGSFLVLLRSENVIVLIVGILILLIPPLFSLLMKNEAGDKKQQKNQIKWIVISSIVASIPIIWWSMFNYVHHGFFGLSDYANEVFYDGWIYFGDASGFKFSNQNSPAMKILNSIEEKYPVEISDGTGISTGWELYPNIIADGYSRAEAFDLFHQATIDSINNDWHTSFELIKLKLRTVIVPDPYRISTFPLPNEEPFHQRLAENYFDDEYIAVPPFLIISMDAFIKFVFSGYFSSLICWFNLSMLSLFFCLYRKPYVVWVGLVAMILLKIYIPSIIGIPLWRYTITSTLLLQIAFAFFIYSSYRGLRYLFSR